VKVVSLKSTLSTFWVVLGGFDDLGGLVCLIYARPIPVVGLVSLYICNGRLPVLLGV
jgi:hypothetical protein